MPVENAQQARRQQAILEILRERSISRQAELVGLLRARGIDATQSSVSRDLRQMGVAKRAEGYQPPDTGAEAADLPPEEFLRGVEPAGPNLTVIRTAVGAASRVAVFLDRSGWPEIVGTLSGDDTIFVATAGTGEQRALLARLRSHFDI
jgi:transcriptional regulator of arginine metabolism